MAGSTKFSGGNTKNRSEHIKAGPLPRCGKGNRKRLCWNGLPNVVIPEMLQIGPETSSEVRYPEKIIGQFGQWHISAAPQYQHSFVKHALEIPRREKTVKHSCLKLWVRSKCKTVEDMGSRDASPILALDFFNIIIISYPLASSGFNFAQDSPWRCDIEGVTGGMDTFNSLADKYGDCTATQLLTAVIGVVLAAYILKQFVFSCEASPVAYQVPIPPELSNNWRGKTWDDVSPANREILKGQAIGKWNDAKILSYCPADGRLLGDETRGIKPATPEDIDLAVRRAEAAQLKWQNTTFAERRRVLRTLLKYLLEHQDEIASACCLDSGKTKVDAAFGEVLVTAEKLKWTIDHGEESLKTDRRPTNLLMMYKRNTVRYEPLGVILACIAWNYPFHNLISPVISSIFAGNSVIVKPSEHTAWSSGFFCDIIRGALVACGHPEDLVQTVVCLPKDADHLTSHAGIDHIIFIGSRPVAHHVCKSAAKSLTPVTVELGGKDPGVILDDPTTIKSLPAITSILMRAVFQSAGQNCVGMERVIALPGTYSKIIDAVTPRIKALRLGSVLFESRGDVSDPDYKPVTPDMGALISEKSFDELETLIAEAVKEGAQLIHGGKRYNHPKYPNGHYFMPTLLANVNTSMRIANTELFAPIFLIMPATDVSDAIRIANSTPYALGASVFGHRRHDVERCVSQIKAGMVSINDFGTYYAVSLPFGGVKGSGYGRFGGAEGLRNLSNMKAVCEDRYPLIQTQIPPTVDYPIQKGDGVKRDGRGAWDMCKGIVETGYQPSLAGKVKGVSRILRNL
ncbi:Meiotic Sister-Chromatid recombination aldehyde dehydrogenase [Onygenales sp. PD_10]|nr:Meiotic Sister-Chromatid recombination aldehyde dehydrogenase [Onygenales sp. PD_10]